jgi:hypothetical protein
MIDAELRPVIQALYLKAKANQVNWVPAADLGVGGREDDFVVALSDYAVNVYRQNDGQATVSIMDTRGKIILNVTLDPSDDDFGMINEMIEIAARKLSGVEEALAALRRALSADGPVGNPKPPKIIDDDDLPF